MKLIRKHLAFTSVLCASFLGTTSFVSADDSHAHGASERLGEVHFEVECSEAAQNNFNVAMAYQHSFEFNRVKPILERILLDDPACGMAHWLRALAMLSNPFVWPGTIPERAMVDGPAALDAAREAGLSTARERDYVEALAEFFKDHDQLDHRSRMNALVDAFERLAERYPDDLEASILYALFLSANFDPTDKEYTSQRQAANILEPIFERQPEHPGVVHYLIHSYDYPPLAQHGIDAARRYAEIAPDAPHALHMPSHIFTLVGLWRESIASNSAAAATANDSMTHDGHHASDYMAYAHLQLGEESEARRVMERQRARNALDSFGVAYPYAAIPARIALETDAWQEAANLPLYPAPDAYPWEKYPQAEAVNAFARGIGSAMSGDPAGASAEVQRLLALRDAAAASWGSYWTEQVDIQAEVVRGLVLHAEGKPEEGVAVLRSAADREDATEKHVVMPARVLPAREILATVLMRDDNPLEALAEFETVLQREPNRLRALKGAVQAAEQAGETGKAVSYSSQVAELTTK